MLGAQGKQIFMGAPYLNLELTVRFSNLPQLTVKANTDRARDFTGRLDTLGGPAEQAARKAAAEAAVAALAA
eukprot:COSAG04_NODE_18295_length_446_cov_0.890490_2_plen_71_part_01